MIKKKLHTYKVKFINFGEITEAFHYNVKSEKQVRKRYALEKLQVVSIEEIF